MKNINDDIKVIWESDTELTERRKRLKERLLNGVSGKVLDKFRQIDKERPEVYQLFKERALQMKAKRKRYSAKSIMFSIRWDMDLKYSNEDFKINDAYIALYVRKLIFEMPDVFIGFFSLRELRDMKLANNKL